ncbi:hypothetical protein FNV43_RR10334 [Rhamnella rubrinervis]|uniref:Uncharacterized protein n=1 Tax=Rhamnella rubrinervis TaxID=2594499 RepID=A0A8K0ML15_9ROSA|nr:hypothetical protein FNV43_RR10334 [Rhamnella rubrinervis]
MSYKMVSGLINANPVVYEKKERRVRSAPSDADEYAVELIDQQEAYAQPRMFKHFNLITTCSDMALRVVILSLCYVEDSFVPNNVGLVHFYGNNNWSLLACETDKKPAFSLQGEYDHFFNANVVLPRDTQSVDVGDVPSSNLWINGTAKPVLTHNPSRVDIRVAPGSHATEAAVNKQLNDKERVAAALENPNLLDMVDECLAPSYD